MYKTVLKITLIISLLINSAEQGYALRPAATGNRKNLLPIPSSTSADILSESNISEVVSFAKTIFSNLRQELKVRVLRTEEDADMVIIHEAGEIFLREIGMHDLVDNIWHNVPYFSRVDELNFGFLDNLSSDLLINAIILNKAKDRLLHKFIKEHARGIQSYKKKKPEFFKSANLYARTLEILVGAERRAICEPDDDIDEKANVIAKAAREAINIIENLSSAEEIKDSSDFAQNIVDIMVGFMREIEHLESAVADENRNATLYGTMVMSFFGMKKSVNMITKQDKNILSYFKKSIRHLWPGMGDNLIAELDEILAKNGFIYTLSNPMLPLDHVNKVECLISVRQQGRAMVIDYLLHSYKDPALQKLFLPRILDAIAMAYIDHYADGSDILNIRIQSDNSPLMDMLTGIGMKPQSSSSDSDYIFLRGSMPTVVTNSFRLCIRQGGLLSADGVMAGSALIDAKRLQAMIAAGA